MLIHNLVATGSLSYNGVNISYVTGSQTSLDGLNQFSASVNTTTGSLNSTTGSLNTATGSLFTASGSFSTRVTNIEGNYATTGSNIFTGAQTVCANITSTGTIIAQTLNVQQVTSSIVYSSGSNIFGCSTSDVQQITGSLRMTGSIATFSTNCFGIGTSTPLAYNNYVALTVGDNSTTKTGLIKLRSCYNAGDGAEVYQTTAGTLTVATNGSDSAFRIFSNNIASFTCQTCAPGMDIMPSGIGVSTLGGIMRVVTTGTSTGIAVGQSNANRYTHFAANDIQVFNDDYFITTRCAFPLSIGTCYTARLTFAATGIACFSCRVCVPSLTAAGTITTTVSPGAYEANMTYLGTTFNLGASEVTDTIDFKICGASASTAGNGFAFWTQPGNTTPSQRLRIDKNGIACFSCTVCAPYIYVNGTAGYLPSDTACGDLIQLYGGNITGTDCGIGLGFTRQGSQLGYIKTARENAVNEASYMIFATQTSTGQHPERMRIKSNGDISYIGRASSTSYAMYFYSDDTESRIYSSDSGGVSKSIVMLTSGTERMRITSGGNVAICNNLAVGRAEEAGVRLSVTSLNTSNSNYNIISRDSSGNDLFVLRNDGYYLTGTRTSSPYNYGVTTSVKALYVDSSGVLGYNASIRESKANITNLTNVNWINSLQPVTFNKRKKDIDGCYTNELESELQYGLIAEDVKEINPDFVFYNTDGKLAGVHYDRLIIPLLKVVQEQQCKINILESCLGIN